MFTVIGEANVIESGRMESMHYYKERVKRHSEVESLIIMEKAVSIAAFVVDKGHENGNEIHVIYNNGIVRIYNQNSGKHITDIIARKPQIERYGVKCTKTMEKKIKSHVKNKLNFVK